MTGAYNGGLQLSAATDIGTTSATSSGLTVYCGSTSFTKGAWTQVVASLPQDASWMMFYLENGTSAGANFGVDIGIGASGFEVAIVANLCVAAEEGVGRRWMFPLTIAAGTRVVARGSSSSGGTDTLQCGFTIFSDSYQSAGCGSAIDTYGFSTSTNMGTAVDPGTTANTKGAYSQITASTVADIAGIFANLDTQNDTTGTAGDFYSLIDIAVGASGSEVVIVPNIFVVQTGFGSGSIHFDGHIPYLPVQIPAGSRIAVRGQATTTLSPDRVFGITIYGVRL